MVGEEREEEDFLSLSSFLQHCPMCHAKHEAVHCLSK